MDARQTIPLPRPARAAGRRQTWAARECPGEPAGGTPGRTTRVLAAFALACLLATGLAQAQFSYSDQNLVASVSGQFIVSSLSEESPLQRDPALSADTNAVHLKTALLAVAAERFKLALWQELGMSPNTPWSGKIYLQIHPAHSLDETVTIAASPFLNHWNYEVGLPDVLSRMRYARALSGVILLELANRNARTDGHAAELPPWLVDGLAEQLLAAEGEKIVLAVPSRKGDQISVGRINRSERGFDPFLATRRILQNAPGLTFDQLSWPGDAQMEGADGGLYYASAQLFQAELLGVHNGREKLRNMVADLPNHYNWQTAFFQAFGADFQHPLDVEKWWALRLVNFAARAPGPRWTTDESLLRLDQLLSVPVEYRNGSNALPSHAEISLQAVLKNLDGAQQESILRMKVRDLALVELRLAPPFGQLADAYRSALAAFLSMPATRPNATNKHGVPVDRKMSVTETVKKLDQLDARRRDAQNRAAVKLTGTNP